MSDKKKLKITQTRSLIGHPHDQRQTMKALGLHRIRHTVMHNDTPQIRGMVKKVIHLIRVEEV
jgi:large subunit ribosomal protein L30